MRIARRLVDLALAAVLVAGAAARAHADPAIEKADQLFVEGRALLSSNLLQACAKFDESLRYNPAAIGTLLNVALCDERLGRIASAVAKFSQARDRAKEEGLAEHLRAAEEHLAALRPSVPHLAIKLAEQLPETAILVDGHVVPPDALVVVPVDPGERVVVVSAPGRLPYRLSFVIGKAEYKTIVVPALSRSVTVHSSRRLIGQLGAAGGAGMLGVAAGLGLYARHLYRKQIANGNCTERGDGVICDPAGKSATDRARTLGNVSTAVGVAGAAIAAVGAYLWYRAPRSTPSDAAGKRLTLVPDVTGDGLGVVALGRF